MERRDELLAQVATLYYDLGKSQQEIAIEFDLSRSNISRMLKEARERGIVEIFIHHPLRRVMHLEQELCKRFGLREAAVVECVPGNDDLTLTRAAKLAARVLDQTLENVQLLGISLGRAVHATVNAFTPSRRFDVEVVQLMGAGSQLNPAFDGPALVDQTARRLTNRVRYLYAPNIVDSAVVARALLEQTNLALTLTLARQAEVALVGIGALSPVVSGLVGANVLTPEELDAFRADGVVGDICGRHFDRFGHKVTSDLDDRVIAITLDELKAIPNVIGVACTATKVEAILGALRGGYLDTLVTDSAAAEGVLTLADQLIAPGAHH
ncbi:MAG: sugar-binding transcriptional regulator [Chloroflexota bacterium]|nr:sugar-binding transcriptional regulator [Chloroflexota bacterium]